MDENLETQDNQENKEQQTTEDAVSAAFDKLEAVDKEVSTEKEQAKIRDDSGKFAKKEEPKIEEQKVEEPIVEVEPPKHEDKHYRNPYASWKKEAQEKLSGLPDDVQGIIQERETQFHKGIQQYKEEAVYGRQLKSAITPYEEYLNEVGVSADQAIPSLLNVERTLRKGSPDEKTQMLLQIAHDYGIDVNSLAQTPFNAVEYQLRQQLAQLQTHVTGLGQSRQMAESANLSQTIEQFAEGREYFEEVRETMADLLDRGLASDLDEAYTKALRLNDNVFTKWQANQQTNTDRNRLEQANQAAKQAKAAAVSVKGSPTGSTRAPESKTTEDAVRIAMAQLGL